MRIFLLFVAAVLAETVSTSDASNANEILVSFLFYNSYESTFPRRCK